MKKIVSSIIILLLGITCFSQNFQDDVSNETIGDFPSQWDVVKGMAITDQVDGYKMVGLMHGGIIKPIVNGQANNYLSNDFTIEFDAFFDASPGTGIRLEVRLWDGQYGYSNNDIRYAPFILFKHGIKTSWSSPENGSAATFKKELQTVDATWRHVTFECKNQKLKILLDGKLILIFPKFKMQPTMVSIGGMINSSFDAKVGFTNFAITNINEEQTTEDDLCGAHPTEAQIQLLKNPSSLFNERLKFLNDFSIQQLRGVPSIDYLTNSSITHFSTSPSSTDRYTIIPIVAHILRKSDHTSGLSLNDLYASVNRANTLFDTYGVHLHLEKILFIDNDVMYNTTYIFGDEDDEEVDIIGIANKNISNKLNIYFVPNTKGVKGGRYSWSSYPSKSERDQHITMNNSHDGIVLTHEIGHWFNLLHTHEVDKTAAELVSGDNCKTAGDLCCDTPADPKLSNKVDSSTCDYTGTDTDNSGENYNPDTSNIMSYTDNNCRTDFSDEQVLRMYNAYLGMEDDRGYTFKVNKEIGEKTQELSLNPGCKAVQHFEIGNKTFMAYFNDTTNAISIYQINKDGKRSSQIDHKDYNGSFHFTGIFKKGNDRYLVLMNYNNGELGIIKFNSNGTLGSGQSYHLETNLVNSYVYNNNLLLLFSNNGEVSTYQIHNDGRLGIQLHKTPPHYKNRIIEIFGQNIIAYNKNDGFVRKAYVTDSGQYVEASGGPKNLGENLTDIKYVSQLNNQGQALGNIVTLNKTNGHIKQFNWTESKHIGKSWYDSSKINGNLESGFDTITPYDVFDGNRYQNYVMISNSTTGKIITYHLNNNM
ncbi:hypothetical protein EVU94_12845 [Flavobacteriaceae bacterium 144Ye]|nr:hypothetical protein EVU94_12845 [Flavobacteriaceae bacterium 144Ye]